MRAQQERTGEERRGGGIGGVEEEEATVGCGAEDHEGKYKENREGGRAERRKFIHAVNRMPSGCSREEALVGAVGREDEEGSTAEGARQWHEEDEGVEREEVGKVEQR